MTANDYKHGNSEVQKCPMRWVKGAIEALHQAAENYLVGLLTDANILAIHAWRITVQPRDIQLARRIRSDKDIWGSLIELFAVPGSQVPVQLNCCSWGGHDIHGRRDNGGLTLK